MTSVALRRVGLVFRDDGDEDETLYDPPAEEAGGRGRASAMGIAGNLTPDQLDFFNTNGINPQPILPQSKSRSSGTDRMAELLDGFDGSFSSIFSTKNQVLELHEVPVVTSSSSFLMVIAEKAFGEDGNLKQPKELSINKVGHGLSPSCDT
ncbi:hypothetical protein B296_00040136 [Ensete ventricosum]|uniref:Uncharacterized protein n=1 Tax=Ensete ventricosum TaxID=4639 RepID=A0A426XGD2_ENSVE|nr:hypothetical protein B296_00040136 [Ensete ventricosum]